MYTLMEIGMNAFEIAGTWDISEKKIISSLLTYFFEKDLKSDLHLADVRYILHILFIYFLFLSLVSTIQKHYIQCMYDQDLNSMTFLSFRFVLYYITNRQNLAECQKCFVGFGHLSSSSREMFLNLNGKFTRTKLNSS